MLCLRRMGWYHYEQVGYRIKTMKKEKEGEMTKRIAIVLNCIIPLLIGAVIYYLISPEVIFVKELDAQMGQGIHFNVDYTDKGWLRIFRNHFLDALWAYALVFALFFVSDNNAASVWRIFGIAFLFSAIMEILQITPMVKGTFDTWDIIVEFLAEIVAVFVIKHFILRRNLK